MPLAPGTSIGHYDVTSLLGEGGMGQVWQATDTQLNRQVALKILPDAFAADPDRLARFTREAQILASLNHPNIAAIFGIEEAEGTRALVLELVEGPTLADRIAKGPIPLDEALPIAKQIAEALEAAHERGVIHRDLKPANVKVKDDGTVKVLDFGLAKALDPSPEGDPSQSPTLTAAATQMGVIMGTAAYMSPEQAKGKTVDKRADIWAFGVVLYEMLAGQRAFTGEDISETLAAVLTREPDLEQVPADVPPSVVHMLRRCVERDPRRRLRDIGDARLELEDPHASTNTADPPPLRVGFQAVTLAAVAATVTGLAVWFFASSSPTLPLSVTRSIIPLPANTELARSFDPMIALSLDGQRAAFVVQEANGRRLVLRSLDALESEAVPGSEGAVMPFFAPDGRWVAFGRALGASLLQKVSVTGGAPAPVVDGAARGATWAPDGTIIFTRGGVGLDRVSSDGGTAIHLTTPNLDEREKTHRLPHVLPDGQHLVFTHASADIDSFDDAAIAVASLETGEYRILIQGGTNPLYVPSGHLVFARSGAIVAVPFDVATLEVTGPPVTVLNGVSMDPTSGRAEMSVSRTGHLLYAPGSAMTPTDRILWVDRSGQSQPLSPSEGYFGSVSLSPDERRLAVFVLGANNSIWINDLTRGTMTPLVTGFENMMAVWAPSGDGVVFRSNRSGQFNLYWQAVDGGPPERLTSSEFVQSRIMVS